MVTIAKTINGNLEANMGGGEIEKGCWKKKRRTLQRRGKVGKGKKGTIPIVKAWTEPVGRN